MSQNELVIIPVVPALAGFVIRWRTSGIGSVAQEIERAALVALCIGCVASNHMAVDWPVLLAHTALVSWLAAHVRSRPSALASWTLVCGFYLSPLFPHKLTQLWPLAIAAWLWWFVGRTGLVPRGRGLLCGGLVPAWGALVAGWTVAVVLSPSPGCGLEVLALWAPALAVLFPLCWAVSTESCASTHVSRAWAAAGVVVTLILSLRLGAGMLEWQDGRLAMGATNANALGLSLVMAAMASVVWWSDGGRRAAICCFIVCSGGALLVQPKGGPAGVWLGAFAATWKLRDRRTRWIARGGLGLAGLAVIVALFSLYPRPFLDRVLLARGTIAAVAERPWIGWGLGNVYGHLQYGWTHIWRAGVLVWEPHNLFLGTAEATGLVGLVLLLVLFAVGMIRAPRWRALPLASLALLGMIDYVLTCPCVMPLLVLAVGVAAPPWRNRRAARLLGVIPVLLLLAAAIRPAVPGYRCTPYPIRMLHRARLLWERGMLQESLGAYLEAAQSDPNQETTSGVWEEGALRCLKAGERGRAASMFARGILVRPQLVTRSYWPRLRAAGPKSRIALDEVLSWAEWEARRLLREDEAGGVMLLGNLTRSYYLAGREQDAQRIFAEIKSSLPRWDTSDDDDAWTLESWMGAWLDKQHDLTGRHRF